jgi:hypothetical protein
VRLDNFSKALAWQVTARSLSACPSETLSLSLILEQLLLHLPFVPNKLAALPRDLFLAVCMHLVRIAATDTALHCCYREAKPKSMTVITPYKNQFSLIKALLDDISLSCIAECLH